MYFLLTLPSVKQLEEVAEIKATWHAVPAGLILQQIINKNVMI